MDTYPCKSSQPLKACLAALPDRTYQLYVEFLTHIDSMCMFIQNQEFDK